MALPIWPPYEPMEAESAAEIPAGPEWQFEPKWDGFRGLAFRDGERIELQSKASKPLGRYFPELVAELGRLKVDRFVLDGEIVLPVDGKLSFDTLLQRIHPAASRIQKLAAEFPARYIVFDLLVDGGGKSIADAPLAKRRQRLEAFAKRHFKAGSRLSLSPATTERKTISQWRRRAGNALDGIIAKRIDLPYRTGQRDGMLKIKTKRTADCVVGGFRYSSRGSRVGSLLLGLYDQERLLHHVGFVATGKSLGTPELTQKLEKLVKPPGFTGNAPGGPSRWSTEQSSQWQPLRPKLVVEVEYDHFTGDRFRHGTRFLRWRADKAPRQCTLDQVRRESGTPLALL